MLQKLQFFFEKEHPLIEINSAPPTQAFFQAGWAHHGCVHPRATEKIKIVKKIINKFFNYHNFKYKMTLPLIDQKMTLREQ